MSASDISDATAVVLFDGHIVPRTLAGLPVTDMDDIDESLVYYDRLIIVGSDADLATVLTRLLRVERLDMEIGFVSARRSAATRIHRLPPGRRGARRALSGSPRRVPLIRDDTGQAIAGTAMWRCKDGPLHGEAVVDDTTLFDGETGWVRIEPTATMPGLRASVVTLGGRSGRWVTGRAAQLGTTGALVSRDGLAKAKTVTRSTFYRHTEGWLLVR